jgi:hypothetical protein
MAGGACTLVWLLALQAQGPEVGLTTLGDRLRDAPAAGLAEGAPEPGALLHPLRIELDQVTPGWRIARLEVRLDGAVIAARDAGAGQAADPLPQPIGGAWSGSVASGSHVLMAVLLLRSDTDKDDDGQPLQVRVERARCFRTGPSEPLALLIQAPPGRDQAPQIELLTRSPQAPSALRP